MASSEDRLDREWIELLNELRVALPGVQVLFAFLLTVPFTQRFDQVTQLERGVYFAAFLCAAAASILLIAPTAYHRMRWRDRDKERMLRTANIQAIAGTALLAAAIAGVVFVVSDLLYGGGAAAFATSLIAGTLSWLWYGLPLVRKAADQGN